MNKIEKLVNIKFVFNRKDGGTTFCFGEIDAYWLITKIKGIAARNMAKQAKVQWTYQAA